MEKKYPIDSIVIKNYVDTINSTDIPMSQIKEILDGLGKGLSNTTTSITTKVSEGIIEGLKPIYETSNQLSECLSKLSNNYTKVYTELIKQLMDTNNGMISTRMIEPLNISRQYLSMMEKEGLIEKTSRGIYISPDSFEDSYFSFQQKYKKAIFSHMNALYFYGLTEEFPYNYTVTVPQSYHTDAVNDKCTVFYVSDEIYEMGVTEVKTPYGNKVKAYDKERCICDIIKSKGRMNHEQVKKTIRDYIKSKDKDMTKLSKYSEKMGIKEKVMEAIGGAYYE